MQHKLANPKPGVLFMMQVQDLALGKVMLLPTTALSAEPGDLQHSLDN